MLGLSNAPRVVIAHASASNSTIASALESKKTTCLQSWSFLAAAPQQSVAPNHWSAGRPSSVEKRSVRSGSSSSCLDTTEGLRASLYKNPRLAPRPLSRAPSMARKNNVCSPSALLVDSLPPTYGLVILTAAASAFLLQWQMVMVVRKRIEIGLKYPKMYEDKEDSVFNCYQRVHQNTLESYAMFLGLLLLDGLFYPITSASLGAVWVFGRVLYSLGYYTGEPKNRNRGGFNAIGLFGLIITTTVIGFQQVRPMLPF